MSSLSECAPVLNPFAKHNRWNLAPLEPFKDCSEALQALEKSNGSLDEIRRTAFEFLRADLLNPANWCRDNENSTLLARIATIIQAKDLPIFSTIVHILLRYEAASSANVSFDLLWSKMGITGLNFIPFYTSCTEDPTMTNVLGLPRVQQNPILKKECEITEQIHQRTVSLESWLPEMIKLVEKDDKYLDAVLIAVINRFLQFDQTRNVIADLFEEDSSGDAVYVALAQLVIKRFQKGPILWPVRLSIYFGDFLGLLKDKLPGEIGAEIMYEFLENERRASETADPDTLIQYDFIWKHFLFREMATKEWCKRGRPTSVSTFGMSRCSPTIESEKLALLEKFPRIQVIYFDQLQSRVSITCKATLSTWVELMARKVETIEKKEFEPIFTQLMTRTFGQRYVRYSNLDCQDLKNSVVNQIDRNAVLVLAQGLHEHISDSEQMFNFTMRWLKIVTCTNYKEYSRDPKQFEFFLTLNLNISNNSGDRTSSRE